MIQMAPIALMKQSFHNMLIRDGPQCLEEWMLQQFKGLSTADREELKVCISKKMNSCMLQGLPELEQHHLREMARRLWPSILRMMQSIKAKAKQSVEESLANGVYNERKLQEAVTKADRMAAQLMAEESAGKMKKSERSKKAKKTKKSCSKQSPDASPRKQSTEVSSLLTCLLTGEFFVDPVIAADGWTYESKAIQHWFAENDTSPKTGGKVQHKRLVPNQIVKRILRFVLQP